MGPGGYGGRGGGHPMFPQMSQQDAHEEAIAYFLDTFGPDLGMLGGGGRGPRTEGGPRFTYMGGPGGGAGPRLIGGPAGGFQHPEQLDQSSFDGDDDYDEDRSPEEEVEFLLTKCPPNVSLEFLEYHCLQKGRPDLAQRVAASKGNLSWDRPTRANKSAFARIVQMLDSELGPGW